MARALILRTLRKSSVQWLCCTWLSEERSLFVFGVSRASAEKTLRRSRKKATKYNGRAKMLSSTEVQNAFVLSNRSDGRMKQTLARHATKNSLGLSRNWECRLENECVECTFFSFTHQNFVVASYAQVRLLPIQTRNANCAVVTPSNSILCVKLNFCQLIKKRN